MKLPFDVVSLPSTRSYLLSWTYIHTTQSIPASRSKSDRNSDSRIASSTLQQAQCSGFTTVPDRFSPVNTALR